MATFKAKANLADNCSLTVVTLPFKRGKQLAVTRDPIQEA